MPGLDDAGVHGPDGNLVHAVAFDGDEGIRRRTGVVPPLGGEVATQWKHVGRPGLMSQPRAGVAAAARAHAEEIESSALHAVGGGVQRGERGVTRIVGGDVQCEHGDARRRAAIAESGAHEEVATAVALVAGPQCDEQGADLAESRRRRRAIASRRRAAPAPALRRRARSSPKRVPASCRRPGPHARHEVRVDVLSVPVSVAAARALR